MYARASTAHKKPLIISEKKLSIALFTDAEISYQFAYYNLLARA